MKIKVFCMIMLSILIGTFFGNVILEMYPNTKAISKEELIYFIRINQYDSLEQLKKEIVNYEDYLYIKEDGKHNLYAGITFNLKIKDKIKDYYANKYNNIYVLEKEIDNQEFKTILYEYDKMLEISTIKKDIENIEKIVIANYKEMVLRK